MRTTSIAIVLLCFLSFGFGQRLRVQSLDEAVANADVIAIVSVTDVKKGGDGIFTAEAKVERTLKGQKTAILRIKDDKAASPFSYDNFFPTELPKQHMKDLGTSRFLVYLKKSEDGYIPSHEYGLTPLYGSGPGARATWPGCPTVDELVTNIEKGLQKEAAPNIKLRWSALIED